MRSSERTKKASEASGVGVGLRSVHYEHVLGQRPAVPWFEATSENYLGLRGGAGGRPLEILEQLRRDYPIALHGVSLNVGSTDPLNKEYLARLKALVEHVQPFEVSDHLCWTGGGGQNLHDLLPLPYTEEALRHVVERVRQVQDFLGRRVLLENVSSYLSYKHSEMTEWEFLAETARRADCGILLDVNNIHVSAINHGFDAPDYLAGIPVGRVGYMHLAGYSTQRNFLIDTHDHPVSEPVWDLYLLALRRFGARLTLIEWDDKIPPFSVLMGQAARAREIQEVAFGENRAPAAR